MKKFLGTIMLLGLGCILTTSCLSTDSEEDDTITVLTIDDLTKAQWIAETAGTYEGQLVYVNAVANRNDSVACTWTVKSDSTLTIQLPVSQLYLYSSNATLTETLKKASPITMTATLHAYANSYPTYYHTFYYVPSSSSLPFSVTSDDGTQDDLILNFGTEYYYAYNYTGVTYQSNVCYTTNTKAFEGYIIIDDIQLNGNRMAGNVVYQLLGTKKSTSSDKTSQDE